jgi:lysophospholipase L1-like esterase
MPEQEPAALRRNWFKDNPKKTLAFFLLILLVGLTFLAEKLLSFRVRDRYPKGKRYIVLREYAPSSSRSWFPITLESEGTDNLTEKRITVRIDENGFIEPSRIHAQPQFTLVFLGASTTACIYMDEENRFPYRVGRMLEKETGLKVNSYNSGVGGNNSLHSIDILINKLLPLRPQMVVMLHNINDLGILLLENTYWGKKTDRAVLGELKLSWKEVSKQIVELTIPNIYDEKKKLTAWIWWKRRKPADGLSENDDFKKLRGRKISPDKTFLLREFKANLQTFIDICRTRDIVPVLMTQHNRFRENPDKVVLDLVKGRGITYADFKDLYDRFNEAIREVGARNGVLVIDLAKKIPQEKEYMYDSVHLTDQGSRLAAQAIAAELPPLVLSIKQSKAGKVE